MLHNSDWEEIYSREEYCNLYRRLIELHRDTGAVHAGGSISILPVMYLLFSGLFSEDNDMLVFSKGHTVFALYCVLAMRGFISEEDLMNCCKDGARLGAHPPKNLVPFAPFATGSLGHGASLSAGLALGLKLHDRAGRVYCICGDGEFQEGSCWEAVTFSVRHKLDNMTIIIDCNGWQGFGSVYDTAGYGVDGLASRLSAFGADVKTCNVHDWEALCSCISSNSSGKLSAVLVSSVKGEGLGIYENTLASHYIKIDDSIAEKAGIIF